MCKYITDVFTVKEQSGGIHITFIAQVVRELMLLVNKPCRWATAFNSVYKSLELVL